MEMLDCQVRPEQNVDSCPSYAPSKNAACFCLPPGAQDVRGHFMWPLKRLLPCAFLRLTRTKCPTLPSPSPAVGTAGGRARQGHPCVPRAAVFPGARPTRATRPVPDNTEPWCLLGSELHPRDPVRARGPRGIAGGRAACRAVNAV